MQTLLSLLLIPFFVLGQALPHSHAGTGIGEPDNHAARPHVHLSAGHSHHHHDGSDHHHADEVSENDSVTAVGAPCLSAPLDHDFDAIYLAQSSSTVGRVAAVLSTDAAIAPAFVHCWSCRPALFSASGFSVAYQRFDGLPIYLLVSSLRL